jgi:HEAT repeat protein
VLLTLTGRLPFRLVPLLRYASEALILKPYRGEIEFAHRFVRDYFALGDLVPKLRASPHEQRLPLIDALGYQGAAAIDTLTELSCEGGVEQRSAALAALSRIAAPEVADLLRTAMTDHDPEIRAAAVLGLCNLPQQTREELAATLADDPELPVQKALFTVASKDLRDKMVPRFVHQPELLIHVLTLQELPKLAANDDRLRTSNAIPLNLDASLKEQVAAALRAMLADRNPRAREKAALWMQCCKPVFDRQALIAVLESDMDWTVREAAAGALSQWDFSASDAISGYREAAQKRRLVGRILVYIRRELGNATWKLAKRARIPAALVTGSLVMLKALGPVFVSAPVNGMATVAGTAAIFILLYHIWYSALGHYGTFHQATEWWDLGWRGNRLAKRVLFLLVCAAAGGSMLAMKDPEWSPLPAYIVDRIVLPTVSRLDLWPCEPVREYRLGDARFLFEFKAIAHFGKATKSHAIQTRLVDAIDSSQLRTLPLINADDWSGRTYRWERFYGTLFDHGDYVSYVTSSSIAIALRPSDYDVRANRLRLEEAVSWPSQLDAAAPPPQTAELDVLAALKRFPAVQRATGLQENAVTRLVGWATLARLVFGFDDITEGPVLLIATTDGTAIAVAILAAPGTFGTDCRDALSALTRRCG